jgi:hypothetical protein
VAVADVSGVEGVTGVTVREGDMPGGAEGDAAEGEYVGGKECRGA